MAFRLTEIKMPAQDERMYRPSPFAASTGEDGNQRSHTIKFLRDY